MKPSLSIHKRKQNIIDWLNDNRNDIEYINYNTILSKLKKVNPSLATDWTFIYKEIKLNGLKTFLSDNKFIYSDSKDISNIVFEKNKITFSKWLTEHYSNIDRLSFLTIQKYIKENCPDMSKVWSNLYGNLKQEGLIKLFNELGFVFYVQDNKKDLNKVLDELHLFATTFFEENGRTPSFCDLRKNGFEHVDYLYTDGWNLDWRVEDLDNYYISKSLPKTSTKSEIKSSELLNVDVDSILENINEYFGNLPSLATLKVTDKFYDFVRFLRVSVYKKNQTMNEKYMELLESKYGLDYVKLTDKLISLDGHWCDSIYELILFNLRYLNGLSNRPHIRYDEIFNNEKTNLICDLYFENEYVCEIAGYDPTIQKHEEYWNKIYNKEKMCGKHKKPFIRIDAYKFITIKLEDYLDYLHKSLIVLYPKLNKFDLIDVIKSQNTSSYLKDIFDYFDSADMISHDDMKNYLSKESYRFYMNIWGTTKKFKTFYESKTYGKSYPELMKYEIDFNTKKFKKMNGMNQDEKIEKGLKLLKNYILDNDIKELPSSTEIEKNKEYRVINDYFRTTNYWKNISIKMDGYYKLCELIGFEIPIYRKVDGWYENKQNIIDILNHMKKINDGWVGFRKAKEINDKEILKLYSYITQKLKSVDVFRSIYYSELKELSLL